MTAVTPFLAAAAEAKLEDWGPLEEATGEPMHTSGTTLWPGRGGRAAATPLEVTAADVLAWDRQRGEPPLAHGFTPEQERAILAR